MNHILRLTRNCLSFDFIGTSNDDSIDDMSTVQIPTNWRPAFLDPNTLQLFFDLYHALPARLASLSLSTLVQITSVRRSLVTNVERAKFLTHLVNGIRSSSAASPASPNPTTSTSSAGCWRASRPTSSWAS